MGCPRKGFALNKRFMPRRGVSLLCRRRAILVLVQSGWCVGGRLGGNRRTSAHLSLRRFAHRPVPRAAGPNWGHSTPAAALPGGSGPEGVRARMARAFSAADAVAFAKSPEATPPTLGLARRHGPAGPFASQPERRLGRLSTGAVADGVRCALTDRSRPRRWTHCLRRSSASRASIRIPWTSAR